MASSLHPWVALVALVAPLWGWSGDATTTIISVDNGGPWGDWGDPEFCPKGTYATGFQLKVEPRKGFFGDDTGLNGVRLFCGMRGTVTVTSSEGPRGAWSVPMTCDPGHHVVAFRLRVEPPRGLWDDTAANNMDVTCSDGSVLEGLGGLAGTWGNWSVPCPQGLVCGLRTRLEPPQRGGDDTGLNDLRLFCCA
ncbi:vitelline membrane outer layer protein 1 homolog [Chroicocephalus ridibundus]|uniref:vitelline membrane outer layer protein 1 homolog n=1 Tax=Chroicocephalus ridibundus TaxID=1192867 RepID=UPI002FDE1F72